jgi:RNA polymerase sigma factor (sigma-70 family)
MTELEYLAAVGEFRAAWIRQAKGLLDEHADAAEDIVQTTITELSEFDPDKARYRYESTGLSDITRRVEYRVRNFLARDAEAAQSVTEEGDDTESVRFKRGKVTVAWVMGGTEDYQRHLDMRAALAALPHQQRYVAAMVWVEGLTMEEVGLKLCVNKMKVSRILEQAKKSLRARLAAYGDGDE